MEKKTMNDIETPEPVPLYAICSHCGHQLGQYFPPCRKHTTTCPKCGSKLAIAANDSRIMIDVLATKEARSQKMATSC